MLPLYQPRSTSYRVPEPVRSIDLMSDGYLESKRNQAGFSKARTWETSDYEGFLRTCEMRMIQSLHDFTLGTVTNVSLSWTRMLEEAA